MSPYSRLVGCLLRLERGEKKVLWKKENGGGIEALALEYPQRPFFASSGEKGEDITNACLLAWHNDG